MENYKATKITIIGRVQGVGFRPFIFSIADRYEIFGTVQNNMDGVKIFAEGKGSSLHSFIDEIKNHPPRISRIDQVTVEEIEVQGFNTFTIIESDRSGKSSLVIPVDTAVCPECLEEMADPANFRYQYPFINCTQCGPRYTIIRELPYDRPFTTMKEFQMCENCQKEYDDPTNRRHHAQPIACPTCGPIYELTSIHGEKIDKGLQAILETKKHIKDGKIVAIKGIGGYHLACDATNEYAVSRLRKRKNRPNRPLAVMAASITAIERIASLSQGEIELLHSPEAPIVIAKKKMTCLLLR
ncbi:acylphosphatase [Anaerobacillus sp. CMMVII]|uniref:acylphosphatase n=1 Tax=Anaerobacillus sp. CMMVII TaxID=2755588 RepID=UPI0028E0A1AF|nr:acylphosphatase [Anaerobacillus sp. CMMVII]